jgi:hypothetical protein
MKLFYTLYASVYLGEVKMSRDVVTYNSCERVRISQISRPVSIACEESHGCEFIHCKRTGRQVHEVTVVSRLPEKTGNPNYKNIALDENILEKHLETLGK